MQVSLSKYRRSTGWQPPLPAALDSRSTLVLVFGSCCHAEDADPFFQLADAFPLAVHAGCSSGSCTAADDGWQAEQALSVAVLRFDHVGLSAATVSIRRREDSALMGAALAAQLPQHGLRMAFLLSDGAGVEGEAVLGGLRSGLPRNVPLAGGLAGDRTGLCRPWVYGADGHLPAPARACVVGLYGDRLHIGQGHARGWQCLGPLQRVTRAHGKVLYELDGQPALDAYKRALGDQAQALPAAALAHPIAVTDPAGGAPAIRSVLAVDECRGALVLSGVLPAHAVVRLMHARPDDLRCSSERAARQAADGLPAGARGVMIAVGSAARGLVVPDGGTSAAAAALPTRQPLPLVGFDSFGEVAPASAGSRGAQLHHQTQAFTALAEA